MNKIVVITMVKNEADIIESMIRHALEYADLILVKDHFSTDDTRYIIDSLIKEGLSIKVYDCEETGYNQKEVMTELLYKAINEEGADLIIPADADEFLVWYGYTSKDLRKLLQILPIDTTYQLKWVNYGFNEKSMDNVYIFNKEIFQCRTQNDLPKCMVGKELVLQTKGYICQGNHYYNTNKYDGRGYILDELKRNVLIGLAIAHFPTRSKEQSNSKAINGWLTNLAMFGKNCFFARYWQEETYSSFNEYEFKQELEEKVYFSEYVNECKLLYTKEKVNYVENAIKLSEILANKLAETTVLMNKIYVTSFILYDGNIFKLKKTINSLVKQTYPYQKIIIIFNSYENVDKIELFVNNIDSDVCFCFVNSFKEAEDEVEGKYLQFLYNGTILSSNKILDEVVFLEKHPFITIVLSKFSYGKFNFSQNKINEIGSGTVIEFPVLKKELQSANIKK